MNISMNQAINLWDELHSALQGKNGYGGDTAEVYLYSMMEHSPSYARGHAAMFASSSIEHAGHEIYALVNRFEGKHSCFVTMEEGELAELIHPDFPYHRIHLKVRRSVDS